MNSTASINIQGFIKIIDLETNQVLLEGQNAINPETMSIAIANMLQGNNSTYIYEMHFGNGGIVDSDTIKDVTENLNLGTVADLYNPLYFKVIDANDSINNPENNRNFINVEHLDGLTYTDLIVTCTLEKNEPAGLGGNITFNEIGLKSLGLTGTNSGYLLTHYAGENVVKTPTNSIQIVYTLRIRL